MNILRSGWSAVIAAQLIIGLWTVGFPAEASAQGYPLAEIKNNTEYTVQGTVGYASLFCSDDRYSVAPGQTWRASSRGVCLITGITGRLSGVPASLRGSGMTSFGEQQTVTSYSSSGTAYAKFQINAFGDRYRIFSENEWASASNTGQGRSPGFRFINHTPWPIAVSFDQVGCLYYGIVPAKFDGRPGEFRRDTGAVWFTVRAHIQPNGVNPQTDWDCVRPVAELVGEVALAAMSGGSTAAASGARIAATTVAKAAVKSAAKKAVQELAKFGALELGEYLTQTSSITMAGQYAGYPWPAQCGQMPEYHITGGPTPLRDETGQLYLEEGPPLTVRKVNNCGNDMMLASTKSATADEVDASLYFKQPVPADGPVSTDRRDGSGGADDRGGHIPNPPDGSPLSGPIDGYVRLQTMGGAQRNQCLEGNAPDRGPAFMTDCGNYSGQYWRLTFLGSDGTRSWYKLQTQWQEQSNNCFEGNDPDRSLGFSGASHMTTCGNYSGQSWMFTSAGDGYFQLTTAWVLGDGFNKCLEGNARVPGAAAEGYSFLAPCGRFTGQLWRIVPA